MADLIITFYECVGLLIKFVQIDSDSGTVGKSCDEAHL